MRVELSNVTLEVHERPAAGAADHRPALVFLHHFGGSGRTWGPVMDEFAADGHRMIAPDLRGFGGSDAPGEDGKQYTVDTMADDVHELLGRLQVGPCAVIAHSMGAKIALTLAARGPADLRGLVLLAPSPPSPEPMEPAERARLLAGHGNGDAARETLAKITARPLPPAFQELALADLGRASAPAWRAWLERGSREDRSAGMAAGIAVPITVGVGARDSNITVALVEREIIARSRHARTPVHVVPDAAHLLPLEAPGAVAALLRTALSGASPRFR